MGINNNHSVEPKLRVGMVSTFAVKCGIATYTQYLCESLKKEGVQTEVLAEGYISEYSVDKKFTSEILYRFDWNRNEPYNKLIHDSKEFDLTHIQHQAGLFPKYETMSQLINTIKKPVVLTLHDVVTPSPAYKRYYDDLFKADWLIVHTKPCLDLLEEWNVDMHKVSLIPHGTLQVEIPDKQETRKAFGFPEDAEIILSWGFIGESKGLLELISVFSKILETHPHAVFIHAGGTHPTMNNPCYLAKTARDHGILPNQFQITNWVPEEDVPKWFAISDVIVLNHARTYPCASGSAHRALASHRPIVKTNDLSLEDIPGYPVPRLSQMHLTEGILTVLEDRALQKKLVAAMDQASMETSWAIVANQHKQIYEQISMK